MLDHVAVAVVVSIPFGALYNSSSEKYTLIAFMLIHLFFISCTFFNKGEKKTLENGRFFARQTDK